MKILFLNIEQRCEFVGLKSDSLHSCYGRCQILHSPRELFNALWKLLSAEKHTRRCNISFDKSLLNSTESSPPISARQSMKGQLRGGKCPCFIHSRRVKSSLVGNPRLHPRGRVLWCANGFCNKGASLGRLKMQLCQ